jgi:hypothetical protein
MDNGQTFSDLFSKFIRMTVKANDRSKESRSHSKSRQPTANGRSADEKRYEFTVGPATSRYGQRQVKHMSIKTDYRRSPVHFGNIGSKSKGNFADEQVRCRSGTNHGPHLSDERGSLFVCRGLSMTLNQ